MSIPGIGHYTAAAIRNFAFNLPTPCIDTNIRRIVHRTFFGPENADGSWRVSDEKLLQVAKEALDCALCLHPPATSSQGGRGVVFECKKDAANWHAALMDFGSLIQTKRDPKWDQCPLTERGLMKATAIHSPKSDVCIPKSEPGREIGGRFVPNRIIRGRIVEELRDEPKGLSLQEIGKRVCIDWTMGDHREWLRGILAKLKKDRMVAGDQWFTLS